MIDKKTMIDEFSKKAECNRAALFIGAGLSVPYGLPDFYQLIKELAINSIDLEVKQEHNYPEIAQYVLNSHTNDKAIIIDAIKDKFNITYNERKSTYLDSIAKSTIDTIWTTNYDTLIEQCFETCEKRVVVKNKDMDFQREFQHQGAIEILKIHGDINSDDVVITKNDYEDFYINYKVAIKRLEQDLLTKSILFIGYSYKDPNIQSIVNNVRQLTDGKSKNKHYMILSRERKKNDQKLQQLWIKDLERYGIQVYILEHGFDELENIIKTISLRSKGKSIFITGSHYDKDNVIAKDFGKRLYEIDGLVLNYGAAKGIAETVCNQYAQECISHKVTLKDKICVYPNPYSFCKDWDNKDFLLDELKALRSTLINETQIIVAFPGGKGTIAEIDIGLKNGSIVIPVFDKKNDEFKENVLKRNEIIETLKNIDCGYVKKLMKDDIKTSDIIGCIQRIFNEEVYIKVEKQRNCNRKK